MKSKEICYCGIRNFLSDLILYSNTHNAPQQLYIEYLEHRIKDLHRFVKKEIELRGGCTDCGERNQT